MANWCYGTILVSGRKTDVHNFIENGLIPAKSDNNTEKQATITKTNVDDYYEVKCEPSLTRVYVDHLYGCFLTEDTIDILSSDDDNYNIELRIEIKDPMRKEYVTETAKQYNINMSIDITDERMQLRQLFVVDSDGNVKEDKPLNIEE